MLKYPMKIIICKIKLKHKSKFKIKKGFLDVEPFKENILSPERYLFI